jgi:hypothetical protein
LREGASVHLKSLNALIPPKRRSGFYGDRFPNPLDVNERAPGYQPVERQTRNWSGSHIVSDRISHNPARAVRQISSFPGGKEV